MKLIKAYVAEFIGTFFLLFCGTGAIMINQLSHNALGHMGIAFAFGLIIVVMIYTTGHISGAHFNPAVTIAFAITGKFKPSQVIPYIMSQFLGALSASLLLFGLFGNICDMGATLPLQIGKSNAELVSFIVELVYTFCLMFVIRGVATDARAEGSFAGLAIGFTVLTGAAVIGPISGGSFNPIRSLTPAIVSGNYHHLWLYIIAPILGASAASLMYDFIGAHSSNELAEAKTEANAV